MNGTIILSPGDQIAEHDRANDELGFRFVKGLAIEKAALDRRLDPSCIRVLAAIAYFMRATHKRAWPGYIQLREITGYSEDRIARAITRLKEVGYIFTERKAPPNGGRALVHYGLVTVRPSHIEDLVTAAVEEFRRNRLTPAKTTRSELTQAKTPGSEKGSTNAWSCEAHPGENNGVRLTQAKTMGSGSHHGKNAEVRPPHPGENNGVRVADHGVFADRSIVKGRTIPKAPGLSIETTGEVKTTAPCLYGDDLVHGVELPTAIRSAIEGGTARRSSETLIDAIRSAQRRGVDAVKIGMSLRKAVAMACKDAGDREPSPSAMLTRGVWFVERSDGETISKPLEPRSNGAPKALNVNRDFHVPSFSDLPSIDSGPYEG